MLMLPFFCYMLGRPSCNSHLLTMHLQSKIPTCQPCGQVSGNVLDAEGQPLKGLKLAGKWDRELITHMPDGSSRLLWRVNPPAADPSRCANRSPVSLCKASACLLFVSGHCLGPAVAVCRSFRAADRGFACISCGDYMHGALHAD